MGTPPNEGTEAIPNPLQLDSKSQPEPQADSNTTIESSSKGLPDRAKSDFEQAETPAANGSSQPQLNGHSSISNGVESKPDSLAVHVPSEADLLSPVDQPSNHKTAGVESETAALHLGESTKNQDVNGQPENRPAVDSTDPDTNMDASKEDVNKGDTENADATMGQDHENDPLFSSTEAPEPAPSSEQAPASEPAPPEDQEKGQQDMDHDMDVAPPAPAVSQAEPSKTENHTAPTTVPESGEKDKEDHVMEDVPEVAPSSTGEEVLNELHKQRYYAHASFFYIPVDPVALNIPSYHNVIKKPMDLQTMQKKLSEGQYENAKEFEADMRLIFKNCYKFNIVGDPVYSAGKTTEAVFDSKWGQKDEWVRQHEPASGHQSAGTSEESSEEEENETDDEQEKLTLLKKQIAEMSKQVEAITKKKKTPPASKKLGKSKSKKDAKKGAAKAADKKDKKSGGSKVKTEKGGRWVTYEEKSLISNGISSLSENRMQEALAIIQKHVPSLRGVADDDIELDIDELPNHVLVVLLKFVKKHAAPSVLEGYEEPSEPEPLPSLPQPKPKKSKPMNKTEQEKQIRSLQSNLSKFKGGAGAAVAATGGPSYEQAPKSESSGDDEDTEESEEE
ncbi:transcription regulator BDF1 [Trichophyton equinum CBS 127.97]|uniref:Transcription regulator BDF1 n=1 Tax=Trichophyton equinum (strain ATCC MYA-4606 / CBS 127.97) TaxID=559882 RepID=F2PSV6_TRIEC|nr:transcription regulator BDF1 [Trichophyton equinum CBS 127.97]